VHHDDLSMDRAYRDMQRHGPFRARLPFGEPVWVLTRYADVKAAHGDRRFGKMIGIGRDRPRMHEMVMPDDPAMLANMDPPDHTRVRRLASMAFAPGPIRGLAGWVGDVTDRLLDEMAAAGSGADFMPIVAWRLPLMVIARVLGVAEDQTPALRACIDQLLAVDSTIEQRAEAYHQLTSFIRGLIADRRRRTGDDLLSVLVEARDNDDRLNEDELVNLAMTVFLGGFETTAAQLGSCVWILMTHRELWEDLLARPELFPATMEELWRWIPSFRHGTAMIRWATEDVELSDGVVVPRGEPVLAEHQVANRDESVYADGWRLDVRRDAPAPHLSLGWGTHRCMGVHVANLEVDATLGALLGRFPTLELAVPAADVRWSPSTFLRSAVALPLRW
jgi:cytochrome P450